MTPAPAPASYRGGLRWSASFVVIAGLHAAAGAGALAWRADNADLIQPPPGAVLLDLAPEPAAPPAEPALAAAPPLPEPPLPEPPPPEPVIEPPPPEPTPPEPVAEPPPLEPPPLREPEVALTAPPPPIPPPPQKKIEHKPDRPKPARRETASTAVANAAPAAVANAAPADAAASAARSEAARSWQTTLLIHLERHKRYPRASQTRREEGVVYVRFAMDRGGRVLHCRLERSGGFAALDEETVAMVQRAQPLPSPPADDPRQVIEMVAPVRYSLR